MAKKSDKSSAGQESAGISPETPPAKAAPKKDSPETAKKPEHVKEPSGKEKDALAEQAKKSYASWVGKVDELKGLSPDQVYERYKVVLDDQRKKFPTKPDVEHHKRALRFFKLQFKQKNVGAGRVKVSGIFYAFRGSIDQVAKRRSEIMRDANLNTKKAAKDGVIMTEVLMKDGVKKLKVKLDDEGKYIPRDNKEFYDNFKDKEGKAVKNPRYGKPLPDNQWSTTYFGLFAIDDDEPQLAFFQMRGTDGLPANCPVPTNVPVSFYAYSTNDDKGTGLKVINGFKTKFNIEKDLPVPRLWQAYENGIFSAQKKTLSDLVDWCAANNKNFNAFFVCYVNFLSKMEEPNKNGTYMVTIDDDSLGFADESEAGEKSYTSLTGFIPGMFGMQYKTFAELSSGVIIAAARRDFKKGDDGKVMTNSKGEKVLDDPVVSIWGFDIDPEFIERPREIEEASEADLEKAAGKSKHSDIDDEIDGNGLKSSKADEIADDDDDDDDVIKKPEEDEEDDEDKAKKPVSKKPSTKVEESDDDEQPSPKTKPKVVADDDDDEDIDIEPPTPKSSKPEGKPKKASEPDDDDIDAILDDDVDAASE